MTTTLLFYALMLAARDPGDAASTAAAFASGDRPCADIPHRDYPPGLDPYQLGVEVEAVRRALADPSQPGALDAVRQLGLDSRYYPMVRGWLMLELQAALSMAESGSPPPPALEARIAFLRQAIRGIDLE